MGGWKLKPRRKYGNAADCILPSPSIAQHTHINSRGHTHIRYGFALSISRAMGTDHWAIIIEIINPAFNEASSVGKHSVHTGSIAVLSLSLCLFSLVLRLVEYSGCCTEPHLLSGASRVRVRIFGARLWPFRAALAAHLLSSGRILAYVTANAI